MDKNLNIDVLKDIQLNHPQIIVGGSVGLFLHGVRLKRWEHNQSDLDLITPYFTLIEGTTRNNINYSSGADFGECFTYKGVTIDIVVNPLQKYEIIKYKGFKYKVNPLHDIIAYKAKYAGNGNQKHIDDLKEMCVGNKKEITSLRIFIK